MHITISQTMDSRHFIVLCRVSFSAVSKTHLSVVGSTAQLNGCFNSITTPVLFSLNCPGFSM